MKLKILVSLVLFLMSSSVFADTYPSIYTWKYYQTLCCAHQTTPALACSVLGSTWSVSVQPSGPNNTTGQCLNSSNNATTLIYLDAQGPSCPGGGTVSGSNCINAAACVSPQVRSSITGMCGAPPCVPPKFVNSFGICEIPECVSYKVPNELTGVCQIPPVCGSTEHYVNSTNSCVLNNLNCPGHSHANTSNNACIPDGPMACPSGQHDDGSYTCVANDATHCGVNQQMGFINGVRQCISSPPLDTAQQEAADKASAQSANAASNADSGNAALANVANNQSNGALVNGQYDSNRLLESIANSTNDANNTDKQKQASAGGDNCDQPPACSGDQIQCEILKQAHKNSCRSKADAQLSDKEVGGSVDKIAGVYSAGIASDMGTGAFSGQQYVSTSFFNLSGSTCQTVQMNYKLLQYTFDPCEKLGMFRNLLGWFAYMYTAVSIVQLARQSA